MTLPNTVPNRRRDCGPEQWRLRDSSNIQTVGQNVDDVNVSDKLLQMKPGFVVSFDERPTQNNQCTPT